MSFTERAEVGSSVSFLPRAPFSAVPLAGSQLYTWNGLRGTPRRSSRLVATAVRMTGRLDTELLRECLAALTQRHDSLRTRIITIDGTPFQQIDPKHECDMHEVDLSAVAPTETQRTARRVAEEISREEIDLSVGPLFKASLLRLRADEHVLVLAADHMISDTTSNEIVYRELWTLYQQGSQRLPFSLPETRGQFADYALWQQETLPSWRQQHESYWKEHLSGAPPTLLPVDHSTTGSKPGANAMRHVPFGKMLSDGLRSIAQREQAHLSLAMLAVFVCTMSHWCKQRDLVVKFVTHGRRHPELNTMVGYLANRLHLRVELKYDDSFVGLLHQLRAELAAAFANYDFDRASTLVPTCSTDLFFNWISKPLAPAGDNHAGRSIPDLELQRLQLGSAWVGKLFPHVIDTLAGINMTIAYSPERFSLQTMERLAQHLRLTAGNFVQDPYMRIGSVLDVDRT